MTSLRVRLPLASDLSVLLRNKTRLQDSFNTIQMCEPIRNKTVQKWKTI